MSEQIGPRHVRLPPKADMVQHDRDVRFVPKADIYSAANSSLFDRLVGARRKGNVGSLALRATPLSGF